MEVVCERGECRGSRDRLIHSAPTDPLGATRPAWPNISYWNATIHTSCTVFNVNCSTNIITWLYYSCLISYSTVIL